MPHSRVRFSGAALAFLVAWASGGAALAHDFWLQPTNFRVTAGQSIPVSIQVGHGEARQRWVSSDRVVMLRDIGPKGIADRRPDLMRAGTRDMSLAFTAPGLHVLALETNHADSDLPAIRFNDYANVEGLTPALQARQAQGKTGQPGREIYSRRAKALLLVGAPLPGDDARVTKPLGLTLEIVPERNPYALKPGEALPVRVLYEGRPLAGATVKLTNLDFDMRPLAVKQTDSAGRTAFDVPLKGVWLLNVIWTKPVRDPRGDFDTTFSSLSFGFPR
jgi:uncharacterized GH25 family protein